MVNKKFWAATFTLTGATIGAGIWALPYVFSKAGIFVGISWVVFLGAIMIFTNLSLGEVCLRTKQKHQLAGLAEKYLGKNGKTLMIFAILFGIYSALLAYLIGEGQSLSKLLTGNLNYSILFGAIFWLLMTLLLRGGLKGLKKVETWGVILIITLILGIFMWSLPKINLTNIPLINPQYIFLPFGVVLFALLGFISLPELRIEIAGQEKKLKKAIILGTLIPIILYIIFSLSFVGILGNKIEEIATLSFGPIVILLGIFTMFTSYFVLSFSLEDMFKLDINSSNLISFIFVSLVPLALYLIISFFGILSFVSVLGAGGLVSGSLTGILILIMNKKAKKKGNRKPEYSMHINWFLILLLCAVFSLGVVFEFFF